MASPGGETANLTDSFNKAAQTYERRMGTATRAVALEIVSLLPEMPSNPVICDNACGTGAVTQAVLDKYPQSHVYATDNASSMIDIMERTIDEKGWHDRVKAQVMDSVDLDFSNDIFDVNIMNFGIFFTSMPRNAANEIYRTLKKGGIAVITCWKESALFSIIFDVQDIIKPATRLDSLVFLEKWRDPQALEACVRSAGLSLIKMSQLPVILSGSTLAQLVESVAENIRGMVGNQWTGEEMQRLYMAAEKVLTDHREKYLAVDERDVKGIAWTAWVATAEK